MPPHSENPSPNASRSSQGSTTILLTERDSNHWLATQGGVPVEGRGESAAEAAAEYCRKVDAMDE